METTKHLDFTKEERNNLAEFIYSYDTDVLIKSDAFVALDVFIKHKMIDTAEFEKLKNQVENQTIGISNNILTIIHNKISGSQVKSIMDEYYGG